MEPKLQHDNAFQIIEEMDLGNCEPGHRFMDATGTVWMLLMGGHKCPTDECVVNVKTGHWLHLSKMTFPVRDHE
jgi:hypothetical protein